MFYELYNPLLVYTNKKFRIISGINSPEDLKKFPFEKINRIRERLYKGPELMDSFVRENPLNLPSDKLELVSSWKSFVKGRFYIFRYLKDYTIFLDSGKPSKAYGVLALTPPLSLFLCHLEMKPISSRMEGLVFPAHLTEQDKERACQFVFRAGYGIHGGQSPQQIRMGNPYPHPRWIFLALSGIAPEQSGLEHRPEDRYFQGSFFS